MKLKLIIALATVAILFTACGKEKENETVDNVIIYNDVTYHMQNVELFYDWDHKSAELGCHSSESGQLGDFEVYSSGFRVYTDMLNQTIDLTKLYYPSDQTQHDFQVLFYGESVCFGFDTGSEWYNGYIGIGENSVEYTEETIFKSGTLTITNDENGFVWAMKGVLRNNDTVDIRLVIPEGWDFEPENPEE